MSNNRPPKYSYLSHLLIAIGVLLLSIFIFNAIGERISLKLWGNMSSELDFSDLSKVKLTDVYALRLSQFMLALAFVFTAFISTKVFRKVFRQFTGLSQPVVPLLGLAALIVYSAFIPASNWLIVENAKLVFPSAWAENFQKMEKASDQLYAAMLHWNQGSHLIVNLVIMALLPAISEEILFRGIFLRVFKSWTGNVHWGVILTSIFFATLHFQPYKFAPMICISVLLCYIFYLSGSLWVPILIHFFNNALVVIGDSIAASGNTVELLEDDFTFPVWATVLSFVVTIALLKLIWDKTSNRMELGFE